MRDWHEARGSRHEAEDSGPEAIRHPGPRAAPAGPVPLFDAYAPAEIARRVQEVGVTKANAPVLTTLSLAVLGGAFISLGALFFSVAVTGGNAALPFGVTRLIGGVAFSLGLILTVVGGAELFTGNNLIAMAWASGRVRTAQILANWLWVYLGNAIGAMGTVVLVWLAGIEGLGNDAVRDTAIGIARAKVDLTPVEALARGILCNVLVCLAIWLCMGARTVTDRILAITFPITAFVACGFEHSIANMYFLPIGWLLAVSAGDPFPLVPAGLNLVLVTFGNILGGTVLVAMVYWFIYLRPAVDPVANEGGRFGDSVTGGTT